MIRFGMAAAAMTLAGWVAGTPLAQAGNDQEFLNAVSGEGYPVDSHTLEVGYSVCRLMDQGLSSTGIERFIADSVITNRSDLMYEAALFEQYATYNLCPRHQADYGGNI